METALAGLRLSGFWECFISRTDRLGSNGVSSRSFFQSGDGMRFAVVEDLPLITVWSL